MKPYTDIAQVYDYLLRHVDYQEWYEYIEKVMLKHTISQDVVVELGCGTGRFGAKFSNDGYRVYGIDNSLEMLRVAKTRAYANFKILCADITHFHLSKKADFIFSVHDTINYLLDYSDISNVLKSVYNIMHPKSAFMFDITTEHNIVSNFDNKTSTFSIRDKKILWSNKYDREKKLIYSTLTLIKEDGSTSVEEHIQRIYTIDEIKKIIHDEGFKIEAVYSDYTFQKPKKDTIMINFIIRRGA